MPCSPSGIVSIIVVGISLVGIRSGYSVLLGTLGTPNIVGTAEGIASLFGIVSTVGIVSVVSTTGGQPVQPV